MRTHMDAQPGYVFDKAKAAEAAHKEGKTMSIGKFQDGTTHAIVALTGQHIRMVPKLKGKAARKQAKRDRRAAREESEIARLQLAAMT